VTHDTESYQILVRVIAEAAPRLDVMDLKSFDLPAPLATPIVALEDSMTELAIRLDFKPLSRPLPFESVQGCSSRCPATGASVSREERPLAE
jgi:hypothetical protein